MEYGITTINITHKITYYSIFIITLPPPASLCYLCCSAVISDANNHTDGHGTLYYIMYVPTYIFVCNSLFLFYHHIYHHWLIMSIAQKVLASRATQCSFSSIFYLSKAGMNANDFKFITRVFKVTIATPLIFTGAITLYNYHKKNELW